MSDLALKLDESKLTGRIAFDPASGGLNFALTLDKINLDRYQPPPTNPDEKSEPIELPVDFLKQLRVKGNFTVGQIKIGGANLTELGAGIDIANSLARLRRWAQSSMAAPTAAISNSICDLRCRDFTWMSTWPASTWRR